jgi:hypothetical protein
MISSGNRYPVSDSAKRPARHDRRKIVRRLSWLGGRVLLRSNDQTAHPRIFPEYFSEPEDLRALARSVRRMRDMMRGPPICDLIEAELTPGPIANEQAAIEEDIRACAATFFHPSGTCRMGSDQTAVVDPWLRAIWVKGAARRRRFGHAGSAERLYPRANDHDRREGRRHDSRGFVTKPAPTHPSAPIAVIP